MGNKNLRFCQIMPL